MLKPVIAICIIAGLYLFWVVRLGPQTALRAFVVELLLAGRSVLAWLGKIAASNRMIYCGVALLVMFAMQWEPLWALLPFIIVALVMRAYKKRSLTGPRDQLPVAPSPFERVVDKDIPVLPAFISAASPFEETNQVTQIEDPLVYTPSVFAQEPPDWNQFKSPAWSRKGLDLAIVLKAVVTNPIEPTAESVPEVHPQVEIPVRQDNAPVECNHEEQQGSFIYN